MLTVLTSNNTLSSIGNFRILSFDGPFLNVTAITSVADAISGGMTGTMILRSFRRSTDGLSWSLWTDFTIEDETPLTSVILDPGKELWIEFRYMIVDDPDQSPELPAGTPISPDFVIESFNLILSYVQTDPFINYHPQILCTSEFSTIPVVFQNKNFTFNPYNVNQALNLYKDLSGMVNSLFGHEVSYYKVNPQLRSADVVIKEWTLKQVEQHKCIKILVPNNEFPDSKPQYNQFGIDFEIPFEIHIDKKYWESTFGKNSMPQQRDVLYFPLLNRIYEVQSTYVYRDFMQVGLYFKVQLVKWQDRADVIFPDNIAQDLKDISVSTEELFAEAMQEEVERVTKPQQYVTITHNQDPTRERVNRSLPITRYNLYNNWLLMSENYYEMTGLYEAQGAVDAVIYRAPASMGATEGRAFTAWFSPQPDKDPTKQVRPLFSSRNASNTGIDVDIVFGTTSGGSAARIHMGANTYLFQFTGITLSKDKWYSIVVNVSNEFSQAGVDLWEMKDGTSELNQLYHKAITVAPYIFSIEEHWRLVASPMLLTNLRIFDRMIEQEKQSLVLTQLVVKDSEKAIVIDNAKPLLRLPFLQNPK